LRAITIVIACASQTIGFDARAAEPRAYDGRRQAEWPDEGPSPSEPEPTPSPPPPRVVAPPVHARISVAVGLTPEAPGTELERGWLDRLERSARVSPDPPTTVRRLRPGVGDARSICRDRRDDMVVMIGYVPGREDAVVLPYDCGLDVALGIRALAAIDEDGLVAALWAEHRDLVRNGMTERRRIGRLSTKARVGIVAGVAIVVIGVAVGLLVANALRDEKVVVKVSP
jgi:hypothetical protein